MSEESNGIDLNVIAGSDVEFRAETIYFLVLDRFAIGNPDKLREDDEMFDASHQEWQKYWGGDLQGLLDRLGYLRSFGISAVWTTPLFEQVETMTVEEIPRAPIHGYWTKDFKRINPRWMNDPSEKRLFQRDDTVFDKLLAEMHRNGMKFVLDIVCNHSSPQTEAGKGQLFDDGKLVADFDNDHSHWYHHYGQTLDWSDEWQVQNCELGGLATFNENNILFRNYIKDAIKMWLAKGVDALRIDTVKHMPLWFWQELCSDLSVANPNLFRFGEWIFSSPENAKSVEFANKSGMTILDFGYCTAVRDIFGSGHEDGFLKMQALLDQDGVYAGATELVTFFENHDMPRLQSLGASNEAVDLALALLITSRGVPCVYYGCEQYLHNDTDGGDDPYNRPMMVNWGKTQATKIIRALAEERRHNAAIQWGGQWPKLVEPDTYVFLRRYRDSRCLVLLNKGADRHLQLSDLEFPDGSYRCLINGTELTVTDGTCTAFLPRNGYMVIAVRGQPVEGKTVIRIQINNAPTEPGDRLAVIGDCPELGSWNLEKGYELDCVNAGTWFGELPFNESAGKAIGYKFVIHRAQPDSAPQRENRTVRRRLVPPQGPAKWRDRWEE